MARRRSTARGFGRRIAVAGAASLVALAAAELLVRLVVPEAVFSFRPVFRADPVVGYTLRPGVDEYAFGARVRANSHGFRGGEWTAKPAAGVFRVALLGDSHAFGFGVEEPAALPAQLEQALAAKLGRPVEVLNLALPGYNARQVAAVLEHRALPLAPDAVVVVLCDNDHRDPLWVDADGWLRWGSPATDADDPGSRIEGLFLLRRSRWGVLRRSRLLTFLKIQAIRWAMGRTDPNAGFAAEVGPAPVPRELRSAVYEPIMRAAASCQAAALPLVLAVYGSDRRYRELVHTMAQEAGVPAVDLLTLFPEAESWDDLQLRFGLAWDPHLGPEAHRRWAAALAEHLR